MASKLHNITRTYGRARVMEMSETYSTSPTRFGTSSNGTWTDNSANGAVAGYISTDGPAGGAGCWEFETTASTTTQEYFLVTTDIETTEGTELSDEDWAVGFWFKIVGNIPDTTSVNAIRLFTATPTSIGATVQIRGQQAATNASQLSVTSSSTVYSGSAVTTGVWHYFAMRRVGSTGNNMYAYLDGTQFANWASTGTTGTLTAYGFNQTTANTAAATWRVSNFHVGSSTQLDATAITNIWNAGNTTPSDIEKELGKYAIERSIEMADTPDSSPVVAGSNAYGTYATNGTITLTTTDGPGGGTDCWDFTTTTSTGTSARYSLSSTNDTDSIADEDYTVGFWLKVPTLPTGTSAQAHHIIRATNATNNGFDLFLTGTDNTSGPATGSKLYISAGIGAAYSGVISANTWYYIAIRRNGSGTSNYTWYLDGDAISTFTNTSTGTGGIFYIGGNAITSVAGNFRISNLHIAPSSVLTATEIDNLWLAGTGGVGVTYSASPMNTASPHAEFPMPTHTAETVINVTYTSDVLTASVDIVHPVLNADTNLDAFGVMGTANADTVYPTIYVEANVDYASGTLTASSEMTDATATTTSTVDYSASSATASALFAANSYAGITVQDIAYNILLRQIGETTNTDGKQGFVIGSEYNNSTLTARHSIAMKAVNGVPTNGSLIKVKLDSAHVTAVTTNDTNGVNTYNIYVFTANPSTTFETMTWANLPAKELLYTTRSDDTDGQYIDLTRAFVDSRAPQYGVFIEHVGTPPYSGTVYDRTQYDGNDLTQKALYILTSEFVNINYNVSVATASAEMTTATVYVERYVNFQDTVATASADIVNPTVVFENNVNISAETTTASAEIINPAFSGGITYTTVSMDAFADTYGFSVGAQKNVVIFAGASTLSALLHMPQAQIGENNSVDHMNASALFVMPLVVIPDTNAADVMTASTTMPNATVSGELIGNVVAEPMRASSLAPNPPAYLDLFGDPWYATLYAQHSVRHGAPYGKAFLKIFEDQNTDITQSTPNTTQPQNTFNGEPTLRQLRNNLTYGIVNNTGPENDIRYTVANAITDYSTATNESRMSVGYFDPYGRKAIRLQNIAFNMGQKYGYSKDDFSLEFSIKTTKSDQVISHGTWNSATGPGVIKTTYNLVDGKLNYTTYGNTSDVIHPKMTPPTNYILDSQLTGNKRIDDGQWHHIIIQYVQGSYQSVEGTLGRFQIWIDGELDIQRFNQSVYDPDFIGANMPSIYASDFYTSAWSMDAPATVQERDIDLHYFDYIKYEPILAEPMTASLTMTQDNVGKGNRGRALMLYWWPTSSGQNKNFITSKFDTLQAGQGEFDIEMFDQELETIDFITNPPQQYYGWDVFPVDINGYFVSDLVKEEAYGGAQNIIEQDLGGAVLSPFEGPRQKFKANRRGYFSTLDDTRRYLDLVNDIDLSKFDAIFFKNYPDQSNEVDAFARNEIVDPYFNITETKIYQDFIKSLRAAVDTGISLMVNNPQLAIDLKIVDRIEVVPDLQDISGYESDPYTPTIVPDSAAGLPVGTGNTVNVWDDTFKNNRLRILNTVENLTDWRCITYQRSAIWTNDDTLNYGGPGRIFKGYSYQPNGLAVGDEFFIATADDNFSTKNPRNYLATPIGNVLAGTPITAFANTYRKGLNLVDNPYKNYVTSIAIEPGDVLDGRQVGGKIWVNFTDSINDENEYVAIDAIHTDWINLAYQDGSITLEKRNALLAQTDLLETQLATGAMTQAEYNKETLWQSNGMYLLSQAEEIEVGDGKSDFTGDQTRKGTVRKTSRAGVTSAANVSFGGQFFSFKYAKRYEQLVFEAMSMNTRGFRWLSDRVAEVGQTQAHTAMPATAEIVQPTVTVVKNISTNAQSMVANAIKIPAIGYAGNDVNVLSLPMNATGVMTSHVKLISAAVMTATADFREQSVIRTTATDQVIVYVLHEDPILYLREDIIK
jgi:hypothetical protein